MNNTQNLGQVVGLYIGSTPPANTLLIWYDSTASQQCHKVYDPTTKLWSALNPQAVSNIVYSSLVNNARTNGLPVGKYYRITDKANALALAITTTKVQYADTLGNILIDDLGTNVQYHVTSSNLLIDDLSGVFNTSTQKLVFTFTEQTRPDFNNDYIFGKRKNGTQWQLVKWLWKNLVSTVAGNDISWNNGFYCSFSNALKSNSDKVGGVISYNKYVSDHNTINQNISNATKNIQNATSDEAIFNKKFTTTPSITASPSNLVRGQTLQFIINNIFRWVNRLRYATGIAVSQSFAEATTLQFINNNDTVETALGKIQYYVKNISTIPEVLNGVQSLSTSYASTSKSAADFSPTDTDTYMKAFAKIRAFFTNIYTNIIWNTSEAQSRYNAIGATRHLYQATNLALRDLLAQLDYNIYHISKDMIVNNTIDYTKIVNTGVFPTDIFRIDLTTDNFNFKNCSFGGIVVQGSVNMFTPEPESYPDNPYRLNTGYVYATNRVLAFLPCIPVMSGKNTGNNYSNASSFIHIKDSITCQAIIHLSEEVYNSLKANYPYMNISLYADIYGYHTSTETTKWAMARVFICNINISSETLGNNNYPHIILSVSMTPTKS